MGNPVDLIKPHEKEAFKHQIIVQAAIVHPDKSGVIPFEGDDASYSGAGSRVPRLKSSIGDRGKDIMHLEH